MTGQTEFRASHPVRFNDVVVLDKYGRLVVAHTDYSSNDHNIVISRYSADGMLDESFGDEGRTILGYIGAHTYDAVNYIHIQDDERIIITGRGLSSLNSASGFDTAVYRLTPSGEVDLSFGDSGAIYVNTGTKNDAGDIILELEDSGELLIAGNTDVQQNSDVGLVLIDEEGRLVGDFGSGGATSVNLGVSGGSFLDATVTRDADNRHIYILHNTNGGGVNKVARITAGGYLDETFGSAGTIEVSAAARWVQALDDGSVVLVEQIGRVGFMPGMVQPGGIRLTRISAAGVFDESFGNDGSIEIDAGQFSVLSLKDISLDRLGNLIVIGESVDGVGQKSIVLSKFDGRGVPISYLDIGESYSQGGFEVSSLLAAFVEDDMFGIVELNNFDEYYGLFYGSAWPTVMAQPNVAYVRGGGPVPSGLTVEDVILSVSGKVELTVFDENANLIFATSGVSLYGTFEIDVDQGSWVYHLDDSPHGLVQTLSQGQTRMEVFTIVVTDEFGASDSQDVNIVVTGANDAPMATFTGVVSAMEGGGIVGGNLTSFDVDEADEAPIYALVGLPVDGLSIRSDGAWSFDPDDGAYQYLSVGEALSVDVTYSVTDEHGASDTESFVINVIGNNSPSTGRVVVLGAAEEGGRLVAEVQDLFDLDGEVTATWQWQKALTGNGAPSGSLVWLDIEGESLEFLQIPEDQSMVGWTVRPVATVTDTLGGITRLEGSVRFIGNVNDVPVGTLSIHGEAVEGLTLSVVFDLNDPDGIAHLAGNPIIDFQWLADDQPIEGATEHTLALTEALAGQTISVQASWTDAYGQNERFVSDVTSPVALPPDVGTLSGIVYHWKNHSLLSKTIVTSVSNVSDSASTDAFQLRDVAYDIDSGELVAQVWVAPAGNALSIDFTALNDQAGDASFTSLLSDQWSAVSNAEDPTALRFAAVLSTGNSALTEPTHLGTIRWSMAPGTRGAVIDFVELAVGAASVQDVRHSLSSQTTDVDGGFKFARTPLGGHAVSAERTTDDSRNAISAADALAALRIAVGLNPNVDPDDSGPMQALKVSPYQFISADVNQDGRVNSADALSILRMAVKLSTALPQEWFFVEETRDFWDESANGGKGAFSLTRVSAQWDRTINATAPGEVNLVGMIKGDVNGSWTAPAGAPDLDVLHPEYFADLTQRIGMPLDQFGVYSAG